jgi:hypothetical protein
MGAARRSRLSRCISSRSVCLLFALVTAGACADGPPAAAGSGETPPTRRDSAGVIIVVNRADTADLPRWRPDAESLRLGVVHGAPELEFGALVGAARLSDGTLVVADNQAAELRFFTADGEYVRTLGRGGDGPGEFRRIHSLARLVSDSLVVWDTALRRATVISPSGQLARTAHLLPPPPVTQDGMTGPPAGLWPVAPVAGGGWLSVAHPAMAPPGWLSGPVVQRGEVVSLLHDSDGIVVDTLARAGYETLLAPADRLVANQIGNAEALSLHAGLTSHIALGANALYVASSDSFRIRVIGVDGELRRLILYPSLEREYRDAEFRERRRQALATAPAERKRSLEATWDPRLKPPLRPSLADLRVDPSGHIWVREWGTPSDAPARWLVLDPDGQAIAVAETPPATRIADLAVDAVVLLHRDELDVQFVAVHRWVKAER